jgi:excisionase family DNA binding protein
MEKTARREGKMTLTQAAAYLGVSHRKITQMVKIGDLHCVIDPLDKRRRLVNIVDLDMLKQASLTNLNDFST